MKTKKTPTLKLGDLVGQSKIMVKVPTKTFEYDAPNGIYDTDKFIKDNVIIIQVEDSGHEKSCYVTYTDGKIMRYLYAPRSTKVELLKGTKLKAMEKLYREYSMKNLVEILQRTYKPTVGSDPEIFAEDAKGQVLPAFKFLGSKEKPNAGPNTTDGNNKIYWDGYQGEFDTTSHGCLAFHVDSVRHGLKGLYDLMKKHDTTAKLSIKTTMDIPKEMLANDEEKFVQFGCMPSFNIYGLKGIQKDGRAVNFRSAGGHIHLGCGTLEKDVLERVVKAMDAILGVACVSLFNDLDDPRRRTMYGLPGEYRTPKHGLEYRVLSNAWMFHPLLMNVTFDLARMAYKVGKANLLDLWDVKEKDVIRIIRECDVKAARKVLKNNATMFKSLFEAAFGKGDRANYAVEIFTKGYQDYVEDVTNFEKNWNLKGSSWKTHSDGNGKNMTTAVEFFNKKQKVS